MLADPAAAGRRRFDIADIVRRHHATLEADHDLTVAQRKVLSAIELCRTAALGGHVDVCRSCGYEHYRYHSCRNRHCPKCQALAQERWIAARTERLLPVRHFHVVFTLPAELRSLAKYRPREVFAALFASASTTLLELGRTRLSAHLGVTMVLHTWTRDLNFHPHVHTIVTAGGLSLDGSCWISSSDKYLFPVEVMGALLRGKTMAALRRLHRDGVFDGFDDFCDPEAFDRLMARLARTSWVVYAKKPFREVRHVLAYLGRYTHRVAISNSRLVEVTDEHVTFRTKNGKTVTLPAVAFLRRFVQHVVVVTSDADEALLTYESGTDCDMPDASLMKSTDCTAAMLFNTSPGKVSLTANLEDLSFLPQTAIAGADAMTFVTLQLVRAD